MENTFVSEPQQRPLSIFVIYDYFTPAYKAGGPIRSLTNLIEEFSAEYQISVICSNKDVDGTPLNVEVNKWVEWNGISVFYSTEGPGKAYREIAGSATVYFINGIYSLYYSLYPSVFFRGRKIISTRGMLDPNGLQQKRLKKAAYLLLWRLLGLHKRCEFHATTNEEAQNIRRVFGKRTKIWQIGNFPNTIGFREPRNKDSGSIRLCTISLISAMKNHLKVIHALRDCQGEVEYNIYGAVKDPAYWSAFLQAIKQLPANVKVTYHGPIPPNQVPDKLAEAHVVVQPSRSENFGHSLCEALSAGRPLITSRNTPWNGLQAAGAGFNVDPEDIGELRHAIQFYCDMAQEAYDASCRQARYYSENAVNIEGDKEAYRRMLYHSTL